MSAPAPHDHDDVLRQPPPELLAEMRRHLDERHGIALVPERDIGTLAADPSSAPLSWQARSFAKAASYGCSLCPGYTFSVGDPPYGDPVRNAFLRRGNPMLQTLTAGLPPDEQEALTEAWDRGELGRDLLRTVRRQAASRTKRKGDPATVRRIERCQTALLDRVANGMTVEEAVDELHALHKTDPEEQLRIFGREWPGSWHTIHSYWKRIPIEARTAAKARRASRPVKDLNAERASRRVRKLTP